MAFECFFCTKCLINANNPIIYWEKWQGKQTSLKYARYCEERFTFQYLFCILFRLFLGGHSVLTRSHQISFRIVFAKGWVFSMPSPDFNCGQCMNLKVFTVFKKWSYFLFSIPKFSFKLSRLMWFKSRAEKMIVIFYQYHRNSYRISFSTISFWLNKCCPFEYSLSFFRDDKMTFCLRWSTLNRQIYYSRSIPAIEYLYFNYNYHYGFAMGKELI